MVANLQTAVPNQDMQFAVEQCAVATLNFNSPSPLVIGALPAGAVVTAIALVTTTAFAGGTPLLVLGIIDVNGVATANYYVASGTPPGVGVNALTLAATALPLATASKITATLSGGATSGSGLVIVRFVVPRAP